MARTLITSTSLADTPGGRRGPFRSSQGAYYVLVRTTSTTIDVYRAADPMIAANWAVQDAANNPSVGSGSLTGIDCSQKGDVLHMVYFANIVGSDNQYRYSTFNMATNTWGTVDQTIETLTDAPARAKIRIGGVRDDGDVVVGYAGQIDKFHGSNKERVDANVRVSGSWGGPIAGDLGGDNHYGDPEVGKMNGTGVDGYFEFVWQETSAAANPPTSWANTRYSIFVPSDSFGAAAGQDTDTIRTSGQLGGARRVFSMLEQAASGGVTVETWKFFWIGIEAVTGFNVAYGDDDALPTVIGYRSGNPAADIFLNGETADFATAFARANHIFVVFGGGGTNGADRDAYFMESNDAGQTWENEEELENGITFVQPSLNYIQYKGHMVAAYMYFDTGSTYYNHKILHPLQPGFHDQPIPVLRTVHR